MKQRSGMPYDVVAFSTDERATLWTLEEEGAFHRLLRHAWINGGIPGDSLTSLAQICRCDVPAFTKLWAALEPSWPLDGRTGRRTNRKQEAERKYLKAKSDAGSKGGSTSQAKRKQTPTPCLNDAAKQNASPLPSPSLPNPTIGEEEYKDLPASAGVPDLAMDQFTAFYRNQTKTEYVIRKADAVQLAALRKANGVASKASPEDWPTAVENYFASPLSAWTLADLATRYGIFRNTRLDRYGKPVNHMNAGGSNGKTKTDRNREAAERLRARINSGDSSGSDGGDFRGDASGLPA